MKYAHDASAMERSSGLTCLVESARTRGALTGEFDLLRLVVYFELVGNRIVGISL